MKKKDKVRQKYDGHCAYSGIWLTDETFSIDHMHPRKPKNNSFGNLQPCHIDINCFKGDLTLDQFRAELMIIHFRVCEGLPMKEKEKKMAELFNLTPRPYFTFLNFDNLI